MAGTWRGGSGRTSSARATTDDSQFFHSFNRNKKSVTLDLKKPQAKAVLHRLVARADGVLDNLRGDLPEKLGLTYAAWRRPTRRSSAPISPPTAAAARGRIGRATTI